MYVYMYVYVRMSGGGGRHAHLTKQGAQLFVVRDNLSQAHPQAARVRHRSTTLPACIECASVRVRDRERERETERQREIRVCGAYTGTYGRLQACMHTHVCVCVSLSLCVCFSLSMSV
jgi:hypothetical protein